MLSDWSPRCVGEFDEKVYRKCVPADHLLRRALKTISWSSLRNEFAPFYSPNMGRPSEDPVLMFKLEFLSHLYRLSDREVIARAQTDMAFRCFLRIGVGEPLPNPSSLCYFRGRLGPEGYQAIFQRIIGEARAHGLIKDRLRLKDATHVIANVAIPTTLALVATTRDMLLTAAEPFDSLRVT